MTSLGTHSFAPRRSESHMPYICYYELVAGGGPITMLDFNNTMDIITFISQTRPFSRNNNNISMCRGGGAIDRGSTIYLWVRGEGDDVAVNVCF